MTVPTVAVTVRLADFGGPAVAGVKITARLSDVDYTAAGTFVSTEPVTATTDATGLAVLNVFPNAVTPTGLGTVGATIRFTASMPGSRGLKVEAVIPNTACNLVDHVVDQEPNGLGASEAAAAAAQAARDVALAAAASTDADVIATAADRVQTGLDRTQTGLDRVATGQDRVATAADRVQTGLDRAAADTSATSASNYAALAATGAKFFDTIALGRAGVADTFTFGVKSFGTDNLARPTVYRRDSSTTQTLLYEVVPGSEMETIRAIKDNIASLRTTATVGGTPASGGNSLSANSVWVRNTPLSAGKLKSFNIFIATVGSGALDLLIVTRTAGTNNFTEKARFSLTLLAGLNSFTDAQFGAITIGAGDYLGVAVPTGGALPSFSGTGGTGYWQLAGATTFTAGTALSSFTGGTVDLKMQATTDLLAIARSALAPSFTSELDTYATRKSATEAAVPGYTAGLASFGAGGTGTPGANAYFYRKPVPQKVRVSAINVQTSVAGGLSLYAVSVEGANVVTRILASGISLASGVNSLTPTDFGQITLNKGETLCLVTPTACIKQDTGLAQVDVLFQVSATVAAQSLLSAWAATNPMLFNWTWIPVQDADDWEVNRVKLLRNEAISTLPTAWTFTGAWTASSGMVPPAGVGDYTSVKAVLGNTYDTEQLLFRCTFVPSASTDRIALGVGPSLCEVDGNAGTLKLFNASSTVSVLSSIALTASLVAARTYRLDALRDKRRTRYTLTDLTTGQQTIREEDNSAGTSTSMVGGELRGSPQIIVIAGQPVITKFDAMADQVHPRVDIVGDSIVNGSGVTLASRWSQLLKTAVSGASIAGLDGTTAGAGLPHFLSVARLLKPKYLVWSYGTNDTDTGLAAYQTAYTRVRELCDAYGITMVICTVQPIPTRTFTNLNAFIRGLTGVKIVQFDRAITTGNDGVTFNVANYQGDNIHPNATGHALLFARFAIDVPELFD